MKPLTIDMLLFEIPVRYNLDDLTLLKSYISKQVEEKELHSILHTLKGAGRNLMVMTHSPNEIPVDDYDMGNILFAAACTQCRKLEKITAFRDRQKAQSVVLNTLKRAIMHGFDKVDIFKSEVETGDLKSIERVINNEIDILNLKVKIDIDKDRRRDALHYIDMQLKYPKRNV